MQTTINEPAIERKPLRAIVEIDGPELRVFPIVDNDADEKEVLDALRFIIEDFEA